MDDVSILIIGIAGIDAALGVDFTDPVYCNIAVLQDFLKMTIVGEPR